MKAKKCTKCGEEKCSNDFSVRPDRRGGRKSSCKSCEKLYRQENIDRIRKKDRDYSEKNRDKIRAYSKTSRYRELERARDRKRRRPEVLKRAELSKKSTYMITDGQFVKIGVFTKGKIKNRLGDIQVGNPRKIELIAESSSNIEKLCHYKFEHLNVRGEWFKMDLELITFFTEHAV